MFPFKLPERLHLKLEQQKLFRIRTFSLLVSWLAVSLESASDKGHRGDLRALLFKIIVWENLFNQVTEIMETPALIFLVRAFPLIVPFQRIDRFEVSLLVMRSELVALNRDDLTILIHFPVTVTVS